MRPFVLGVTRYNEPDSILGETLESAIASELQPVRRLVVNDGPTPLGGADGFEILQPDHNIGCAGAWNLLCHTIFNKIGVGTAIILNGDCAVAPDTFSRMTASECHVVAALGFSAYRLDSQVWWRIGAFDEKYYPAYWEDTDYRRRLQLAGEKIDEWPIEEVSRPAFGRATYSSGITHGWLLADSGYQGSTGEKSMWFQKRWEANRDRYAAKWGGPPGSETYDKPFNVRTE